MSTKKASNPLPKDFPKPPPPPPPRIIKIKESCSKKVLRVGSIVKYNKRKHVVIGINNKNRTEIRLVRLFKSYTRLLSVKYLFGDMINDLEILEE